MTTNHLIFVLVNCCLNGMAPVYLNGSILLNNRHPTSPPPPLFQHNRTHCLTDSTINPRKSCISSRRFIGVAQFACRPTFLTAPSLTISILLTQYYYYLVCTSTVYSSTASYPHYLQPASRFNDLHFVIHAALHLVMCRSWSKFA